MEERIETLAKFLGCKTSEIKESEYDKTRFYINNEEYLVLSEDEADSTFYEMEEMLIDDLGFNGFSEWGQEYIKDNFLDNDKLEEIIREQLEYYCDDIELEESFEEGFENRLEEELKENDCSTKEEYIDFMISDYEDNYTEYFIFNLGEEGLNQVIKSENLVNWDEVIAWVETEDGRGNTIATYDGVESEQDDYFIYRLG